MKRPPADLFLPANAAPAGTYRLLGADASYFTAKISAYLRYKRIPHHNVLATRRVFAEEILPRVGWPVIPVLLTPSNATLQDTSEMFDYLEARYPTPATLPADAPGQFLSYWLELCCDEWLKLPALHYRWHYDNDFAVCEFGRNNDPALPLARQRASGEKIAARFRGWVAQLGISAATIPAIEAAYHALLAGLDAHFAVSDYLLGAAPTLADFALYGPLHAHLYRDPNAGQILKTKAPKTVRWLQRMGDPPPLATPATPTVPAPTLWPILQLLARDYVPVLVAQNVALRTWLSHHNERLIPPSLGRHHYTLGHGTAYAVVGERSIFSYDQWMLQRALQVWAHADPAQRDLIAALCERAGAGALLALPCTPLLRREDFKLRRV
ncbi:MAG: glutathione S-transferase [Gammaproteobacteria bacterium]|nr:glutathione S-transferase [Gammaproteobacteria bacterium]